MNTTLTPYYFNSRPVRSLTDESGNPWFIAADVCEILDIKNPTQSLEQLEDDEKKLDYVLDSSGQRRKTSFISESGLYTLIIRSNKPEAKVFRKWVTSEVLPSIRKTGVYSIENHRRQKEREKHKIEERPYLESLFYKNVDRLHDDMLEVSETIGRVVVPKAVNLLIMGAITQAGVCRSVAMMLFPGAKK